MSPHSDNLTIVQHYELGLLAYRTYPLGDNDLCHALQLLLRAERSAASVL